MIGFTLSCNMLLAQFLIVKVAVRQYSLFQLCTFELFKRQNLLTVILKIKNIDLVSYVRSYKQGTQHLTYLT